MSRFWTLVSHLHSLAGPVVMLLYPLYASVMAIESPSKADDEQWLAYWILYSFITLAEMLLQPLLEWIPIWNDIKLVMMVWLVLPQFKGAAFLYEKFVREKIINRYRGRTSSSGLKFKSSFSTSTNTSSPPNNGKQQHHHQSTKNKFMDFVTHKKGEHEAS